MKATVTKFLNGKQIAEASTTVASAEALKEFVGKFGVNLSKEDAEFHFDIYFEKNYIVEEETEDVVVH